MLSQLRSSLHVGEVGGGEGRGGEGDGEREMNKEMNGKNKVDKGRGSGAE